MAAADLLCLVTRQGALTWLGVALALFIAALLWAMDTDALLSSLTPTIPAWIALGILWCEIGALTFVFVRRYRLKQPSLGICVPVAWACAGLNLILTLPLVPALALGI